MTKNEVINYILSRTLDELRKQDESIKTQDMEPEYWAAIIRVKARPGWDGKTTIKSLLETLKNTEDPGQIVQLCRVDKDRKLAVTYLE